MDNIDPYGVPAGRELDALIHFRILKNALSHQYPAYSSNPQDADKLKKAVETQCAVRIEVGQTRLKEKRWFARYEIASGNPTEVLAETYPLAVSRLAVLLTRHSAVADRTQSR
jgi:hypothetical protein